VTVSCLRAQSKPENAAALEKDEKASKQDRDERFIKWDKEERKRQAERKERERQERERKLAENEAAKQAALQRQTSVDEGPEKVRQQLPVLAQRLEMAERAGTTAVPASSSAPLKDVVVEAGAGSSAVQADAKSASDTKASSDAKAASDDAAATAAAAVAAHQHTLNAAEQRWAQKLKDADDLYRKRPFAKAVMAVLNRAKRQLPYASRFRVSHPLGWAWVVLATLIANLAVIVAIGVIIGVATAFVLVNAEVRAIKNSRVHSGAWVVLGLAFIGLLTKINIGCVARPQPQSRVDGGRSDIACVQVAARAAPPALALPSRRLLQVSQAHPRRGDQGQKRHVVARARVRAPARLAAAHTRARRPGPRASARPCSYWAAT
jgi:hypothetical protein